LGLGGDAKAQQAAFDTWKNSTGFDFQLQTGADAVASNKATQGLLRSGSAAKSLTKFGQDLGSTYFGNYLNALSGQQQVGLTATGAMAGNNTGAANALTGIYTGQGSALASNANQYGTNTAGAASTLSTNQANLASGYGKDSATLATNQGSALAGNYQNTAGNIAANNTNSANALWWDKQQRYGAVDRRKQCGATGALVGTTHPPRTLWLGTTTTPDSRSHSITRNGRTRPPTRCRASAIPSWVRLAISTGQTARALPGRRTRPERSAALNTPRRTGGGNPGYSYPCPACRRKPGKYSPLLGVQIWPTSSSPNYLNTFVSLGRRRPSDGGAACEAERPRP
jgi:hypothetical protein